MKAWKVGIGGGRGERLEPPSVHSVFDWRGQNDRTFWETCNGEVVWQKSEDERDFLGIRNFSQTH